MTISELMAQTEKEDGSRLLSSSSNRGWYNDNDNDYDDAEVLVMYKVSSATKAIRSGQALGENVLIVDPSSRGLYPDVLSDLCCSPNPNQPHVYCIDHLPPKYGQRPKSINPVNNINTLIYVSCGFDVLDRDTYRLLSLGGGWKLRGTVMGYVLFPGSDHGKTITIFERSDKRGSRRKGGGGVGVGGGGEGGEIIGEGESVWGGGYPLSNFDLCREKGGGGNEASISTP